MLAPKNPSHPLNLPRIGILQSQVHIMWDKDLMDRPRDTLQGLFDFLSLPMTQLPSWDKQAVDDAVAHAYVGNGVLSPNLT
jgi:hypothetical protein